MDRKCSPFSEICDRLLTLCSMIAIAAILMTVAHPGIFFPAISSRYERRVAKQQSDSEADESMQQPMS